MEIRQFRYFVSIADMGSLSRASRALHIAQPALSQQMAQLEAELGQPLLVRLPGGVRMTDQGEVFYRHAQRILKQLGEIAPALEGCAGQPTGVVALGLPQSNASQIAMPLLAALASAYPGIAVEFFDEISGNLLSGLNSGRLDLAVLVSDEDAGLLQSVPLMQEELFLVSRTDLAPRSRTVTLRRLAGLPLALPGLGHGVRAMLEQAVLGEGLVLPLPRVVANSMGIMRQAIREGIAHGVMPWAAVAGDLEAGILRATPLAPRLRRRVWLCTAPGEQLSLAGQAVATLLAATTRERIVRGDWPGALLP